MDPALANFLFEAVNFLLLAGALGWLLFKPVRRALDAEQKRHAEVRAEAEQLRVDAVEAAAKARESQEKFAHEMQERRREVLEAAKAEASRLVEDAKETRSSERRSLEEELRRVRAEEAIATAETIGRVVAESVRRLLEALPGPSLDAALAHAACAQLEALPSGARGSATVETARALDPEARRLLEGALGGAFEARVVAELGAGIRVTTPAGQVDATALSLARAAARAVREAEGDEARPAGHGDD